MAISKDNVLFVYRNGDSDSHNLASYYQQIHELDSSQLLGISCSNIEILPSYSSFENEVEMPIRIALPSLESSPAQKIWVIILGYNVPGGFYDDNDIISSTSRISRIHHTYNKNKLSNLYNRIIFKRYDSSYASSALIVSRIDGPTYNDAKNMIDKAYEMKNQALANGKFFFDPFSDLYSQGSSQYINDLTDFYINKLFDLNMSVCSTTYISPYIDVVFPYLQHDSFYWGWSTDRTTETFFRSTDTERIFFYNADLDSAITVKNTATGNFCPLAILNDYVSVAGAMSNPTTEGFLRPRPFFDALYHGATLGEAYLFSNPYYDWTIAFFGDPLVRVVFYSDPLGTMTPYGARVRVPAADDNPQNNDYISPTEINIETTIELAEAIAYYIKKERSARALFNSILLSSDVGLETSLLYPTLDLMRETNSTTRFSRFYQQSKNVIAYIRDILIPYENNKGANLLTVDNYLSYSNLKLSRILLSMISNIEGGISNNNLYDEGYWEYEHVVIESVNDVTYYNFILQVASDSLFSNIVYNIDSISNKLNWYYELEENVFSQLPVLGFPSNYVGRRIKYISPADYYLTRAEIYYFRIKQISTYGNSSYITSNQIIYT